MRACVRIDRHEAIGAERWCVQLTIATEIEAVQRPLTASHDSRCTAPRDVDFPQSIIARSTLCDEESSPIVECNGIDPRHVGQCNRERAVGPPDA